MDADTNRVLIAGAGDLGLALGARLVAAGMAVTTLNRTGRGVAGAQVWVADLSDRDTLRGIPDFEIVVLTTAPPGRDEAAYRLAYVDGPAHLLAALPIPPTRVVLTSSTGVYGIDDGSWVDETSPVEPIRPTAAVVAEGEARLHDLVATTSLRSAGIYGPGRGSLASAVRDGDAPVARDHTPRWTNRVHRDDVVTALASLVAHPAPPPAVIAVDDEPARRDDVIEWLVERLHAPAPATIEVAQESGKRCRNTLLRSLGWVPRFPTYREGYTALLD